MSASRQMPGAADPARPDRLRQSWWSSTNGLDRSPGFQRSGPKNRWRVKKSNKQSLTLSICANGTLALLLFMQSLAIHRHEEVIQRLSQCGMCKDAVANNGIRQLPHHGDLQYRHHFPAFHSKDRAT